VLARIKAAETAGPPESRRRPRQQRRRPWGWNFDPAQFRQQFEDRVKEQLGANDDEWKVIQPKLTKVFDAQRGSRGSMRGCSAATAAA
jgi:hypothetical protein